MAKRRAESVLAGFAVGDGEPVEIPLTHLCVTGQTQRSGKTTTLEALVQRSGLRAIAFQTKRGERAFNDATEVDPYFSDAGDWQFVASILEASRGERMKFERSWIIKASRGADTLSEVHANVKRELETARGISEGVYTVLDAYLDVVVPQISKLRIARRVELGPGLNVMDLTAHTVEMQALVIRSVLEWIHEREEGVITIIPEAWEFIPQNRGSPVKLSIERLIRKGAGLRNFVWLDSQDLGGIHKDIVRSCAVMLFGVQREANEIRRNLANIPAGMRRPPANAIAELGIGEFYVCHGKQTVRTYIWPTWVEDKADAIAIAKGHLPPESVYQPPQRELPRRSIAAAVTDVGQSTNSEDPMTKTRLDQIDDKIDRLADLMGQLASFVVPEAKHDEDATPPAAEPTTVDGPAQLTVNTTAPTLTIDVKPRVMTVEEDSPRGRVAILIADGFFITPRAGKDAYDYWKARGFTSSSARIYEAADTLTRDGFLVRHANKMYQQPANLAVDRSGKKQVSITIKYK